MGFNDGFPDGLVIRNEIVAPFMYISDTAISNTVTLIMPPWPVLGGTPGVYAWTWGTGADQSFTLDCARAYAAPPLAFPLFATGLD